jgi:D-3-phosphoglycerate dehydrogenase / 2-oxoglutarate reductase
VKRFKVMVSAPYMVPEIDRFRTRLAAHGIEVFVPPVEERLEEADLLRWVGDVDGVICGDDRFTERVLAAAPRLKVIAKWGTGTDSIDREACARRGVVVRNTPDAFSGAVADSVLGYVLCFARRLPWMHEEMRQGKWRKLAGVSLGECTLGVIGVGAVGKAVVRRATAFGMTVLGNDPAPMPAEFLAATDIAMVDKTELLRRADFVSINCDLNPTSYHLVGTAELSEMKAHAVLINTARGPIVDEAALVRALGERRLGGAALDVFEHEPLALDSPLRAMEHVMLAAHNANSSPAAWERVHENTIRNLLAVLDGSCGP